MSAVPLNLPTELWIDILELAGSRLFHTVVCRAFNTIATPTLYREVALTDGGQHIHLFLRTIISRPHLGRCVRSLHALPYDEFGMSDYPGDLPGFVAEAISHGLSLEIQRAIADGSSPAMLFLLQCYLPRLTVSPETFSQFL